MSILAGSDSALDVFHPLVGRWFAERVGQPTEIQSLAWPRIAAGENVLVTAPTGSGKTLAAFLWALDRLLTGAWEGGRVRVLYVSPLRALNNDIRRNLLSPLAELEASFAAAGEEAQPVRVLARSGDTPPEERRRALRHPPEVLITTPESLNILLTSKGGRSLLGALECVVLDEIHAVASAKRGTHLTTAVERLTLLSGEFQRIALSATVRPLERVAALVGGRTMDGAAGAEPGYRPRRVAILRSAEAKRYDLRVVAPAAAEVTAVEDDALAPPTDDPTRIPSERRTDSVWPPLVGELRRRIASNRSTLLFANSRRVTEKVTRLLNGGETADLAYSHHGSLSRELRAVVERRLKEGSLAAIVATNSLELGIDVGALDEVLLLRTPPTIASAVQRVGRAGHRVGAVSRARLYPLFERDYLDAAVVARGVLEGDIEEAKPPAAPLDVLAQVVLSMVAAETWRLDDLFRFLRTCWSYRDLSRTRFDLVVEMLAGRYADARLRELHPRVAIDRVDGTIRARPGAARLIYLSGGTIPDRGYYHLRLADSMAKLGELDEEFVWERSVGDTFSLGAQSWRIQAITHNDVLVTPARRSAAMAPFWRAEERDRSFHLSARIGELLAEADELLGQRNGATRLRELLATRHAMEEEAAAALAALLERQQAATGRLPHRRRVVAERVRGDRDRRLILHTFWGGKTNRPFAIALAAAWEEAHGVPLEIELDNDCLMLPLAEGADPAGLFELVRPDNLEPLLRRRLERGGFFGARFRECAGRALLLPRGSFRRRVPLWLNRQRAKRLLESVADYGDFPVLLETWRTCLQDAFELEALAELLAEIERGEIEVAVATTDAPSPFAANVLWKQTNRLMYEDDSPAGARPAGLSRDLLRELVYSSRLRPRLPAELVDRFQRKLHRTYPGYAPRTAGELLEWIKERIAIPETEWGELLAAVERELTGDAEAGAASGASAVTEMLERLAFKAVRVIWKGGDRWTAHPGRSPEGEASVDSRSAGGRRESTAQIEIGRRPPAAPDGRPVRKPGEASAPPPQGGGLRNAGLGGAPSDGGQSGQTAICAVERLPHLLAALDRSRDEVDLGSLLATTEPPPREALAAFERLSQQPSVATGTVAAAKAAAHLEAPPEKPSTAMTAPQVDDGPAEDESSDPVTELVAEWIRFYGPFRQELLGAALGLDAAAVQDVLETLAADERVVIDAFREGADEEDGLEVCDAENLERLLRLLRAEARPAFEPLPPTHLPLFLARWQGVGGAGDPEALKTALERLFGYPAPAGLWETDLLPARLDPYYTAWLDALLQASELLWTGCGRRRLTFVFPEDLDLLRDGGTGEGDTEAAGAVEPGAEGLGPSDGDPLSTTASHSEVRSVAGDPASGAGAVAGSNAETAGGLQGDDAAALFPDPRGRFGLEDLARHTGRPTGEVTETLWQLAWRGAVSNTGFAAVRQAVLNRFRPAADASAGGRREPRAKRAVRPRLRSRRPAFERWSAGRAWVGDWYRLDADAENEPLDALEAEELNRERVRLLLARYGVLFRELLARELPALRWGPLFRTLRLMELSGELLAGCFFSDVPGLQFASPAALRALRDGLPEDTIYWLSAADPASPCGLGLEALRGDLPPRLASTHLVFHGPRPVLFSRRHAAELEIRVAPDHPDLASYFEVLKTLLTRQFNPRRALTVETINGDPAATSPYAPSLAALFAATRDRHALKLRRRY